MANCDVCKLESPLTEVVCEVSPYIGKKLAAIRCNGCGFIQLPGNTDGFESQLKISNEQRLRTLRNATEDRPGREFFMAEMGIEILGIESPEITFFGAGLNIDHQWTSRKYQNARTKLVDVENMQNVNNFEHIEKATTSDIVVAAEVIEHFYKPVEHFKSLFDIVRSSGILICSSNIYDGSNINRHQYPFTPDHSAYWTPLSLVKIASDFGYFVDFRTPAIGPKRGGPRKKYILFYRQIEVQLRISVYFGTHMFAPSESQ